MSDELSAIELPVEVSNEAEKPFDTDAYLKQLEDERDKVPEEATEEVAEEPKIDSEAPATDEKAAESEPVDIEKAIEELNAEYAYDGEPLEPEVVVPTADPVAELSAEYERLKQLTDALANAHPAVGLPPLEHNGKSLYEMTADEQNDYLTHLADQGRMKDAMDARDALVKYQANIQGLSEAQAKIAADVTSYNERLQNFEAKKEEQEWNTVGKLFKDKIPMDAATEQRVTDYVVQLLQTNKRAQELAKSPKGKGIILREALVKVGVFNQLQGKQQGGESAPSVPDATISNKKVQTGETKRKWTRAAIDKLTVPQYAKHEAEILAALAAGEIV
jgi:chromosome segregation ATPase